MSLKDPTIGLWAVNLGFRTASQDEWVALVHARLLEAAAEKADMLVIPEHISESWVNYQMVHKSEEAEARWVMDQAAQIVPRLQELVVQTGVALVTGSSLYRDEATGEKFNRAWALFPDRAPVYHDKCVLTPSEKNSAAYNFQPGCALNIFEWRGWRAAMIICLDVEMPMLAHLLAGQDIDLVIVPSLTTKTSGFHRVFSCARARAVELMAAVSVVAAMGGAGDGVERGSFNGGAAVYVPSEEALGSTGIFAELPVHGRAEGPGAILYARDVPLTKIRASRRGTPEAWPGAWSADHIKINVV